MFVDQIDNPEYDHIVETLKTTHHYTLAYCFQMVNTKAQDLDKPKLSDRNTLTPRKVHIQVPEVPTVNSNNIDLKAYIRSDGHISLPGDLYKSLAEDQKSELRKYNSTVKYNNKLKQKQHTKSTELDLPSIPPQPPVVPTLPPINPRCLLNDDTTPQQK